MNQILTEKHRPIHISNYVGNEAAISATKSFFFSWQNNIPRKRGLLYYGPPGVGKTTLALMLAHNTKKPVIHYNASDLSKKEDVKKLLHITKLSTHTEETMRLIIIDECDRISKSGQKMLAKVITENLQPVILICNDISKINPDIKNKCISIVFSMVPEYLIKKRLNQIAKVEGYNIPADIMNDILQYNKTVRGAINSLQDYLMSGEVSKFTRDLDLTETQKLERILSGQSHKIFLPLDMANAWISNSHLEDHEIPSRVDIIVARVMETHDYSLWDAGYGMLKQARGELCNYPEQFVAMYKNKKPKMKDDKDDGEHISIGKKKTKREIKPLEYKEHKINTVGIGDFI